MEIGPFVSIRCMSAPESSASASSRASLLKSLPRRRDVGVLAFVPDRWSPLWQVRQHVMTRMAQHFHVVWVNPALGIGERSHSGSRNVVGPDDGPLPRGFQVYSPRLPEFYGSRTLSNWSFRLRLREARSHLKSRGVTRTVAYLWRPTFARALDFGRYDLTVYHIDDEYSFSSVDVPVPESERALIARVDQVFIHSPGLMERKGDINPHTEMAPLGVAYEAYAAPQPEPAELAAIPHPRIGYVGVLKKTLNWELLAWLADRNPQWSLVLLGPLAGHPGLEATVREFARRPNVTVLPGRPTRELTAFPQHLDVGIMPYVPDDYSKYGYPLKLHEYLAGGCPVVGTRMRTLEDFPQVVGLATTPAEWQRELERALRPEERTEARTAERRVVAKAHDWDALVARLAKRIEERLG